MKIARRDEYRCIELGRLKSKENEQTNVKKKSLTREIKYEEEIWFSE